MKSSEVLTKAAEIMIERGHGKGRLVANDGRVCIVGAVCMASWSNELASLERAPGRRYLDAVIGDAVFTWNDSEDTTEAMALGALHEAALLAKEQGD